MKVLRVYHAGRDPAHRERDRALVRAGAQLTLVVPSEWPGPSEISDEPFEIVQLPVRRPGDVNRHTYRNPERIAELVERLEPDILDLHEEPFSSVVHQLIKQVAPSTPIVAYTAQNIDKRFPPPFAGWERQALARVAGLYPCSRQAASVAVGKGFRGVVRVLPLAPPPQIVSGNQEPPSASLAMLLVGRLVPEKGVLDAVRVLADLSQTTATTLDIVGDGPEAEPARRLAARLGVADALTVRPWLGAAELAERYRHAHVVLAPSRATRTWVEQFGRMVVEAHAAGAVVAGYASGSLPEVVGDEGVLVSEGDQGALSAAIRQLCDDPDRWQKLRNAGLERAARSTWDDVARGALELYDEARRVRPGARVRAQRGVAAREWGLPATVAGGGRPFAVPLLRDDTLLSRGLAHALDVVNRETAPPRGKLLRVVYVDHVARLSGGELAMLRLIDALPDVEAHVILGEDGPLRPALENAGATIEILPLDPVAREVRRGDVAKTAGTLRATAFTIQYALKLALRLRQLHPDIVHTNSLKSGYYGTLAARLARVPVIWHLRDRLADDYLPRRAATFTRALLRVLPDVVVCNSHETLRTAGRHIRKGTVIGSPVVHDPYAPVRARVSARDGTVVGIVGRLADWKGQREFIRAFAALHADYPGLHARIVGAPLFGEDAYNAELHALVEHLGLDQHVTFVGFVEDVEEELAKLDILVHASIVPEPFGQVVVEGMAAGLPVIATGAGGPAEIIEDGVNGLLVPPGDVPALTAAVRRLLGDAELRARIGQAGIERAKDFAPELIGKQMRAVYESALGRR